MDRLFVPLMVIYSLLGSFKMYPHGCNCRTTSRGQSLTSLNTGKNSPDNKNSIKEQEIRESQKIKKRRADITRFLHDDTHYNGWLHITQWCACACACVCACEIEHKGWMWNYSRCESPTFCRRDQVNVCFININIAILYIRYSFEWSLNTDWSFLFQTRNSESVIYFMFSV